MVGGWWWGGCGVPYVKSFSIVLGLYVQASVKKRHRGTEDTTFAHLLIYKGAHAKHGELTKININNVTARVVATMVVVPRANAVHSTVTVTINIVAAIFTMTKNGDNKNNSSKSDTHKNNHNSSHNNGT